MVPTAATVPGPEPEMAAKNVQARMVVMPRPPLSAADYNEYADMNLTLNHHVDDLLRDVPELHERACDHKTGDGEQREQVQAVKKRVVDDRQGQDIPAREDRHHGRDDQGHEDRQPQQEHGDKDNEGNG